MSVPTKLAKSFTIDREVEKYVAETKGNRSASERVNELLISAMKLERYERFGAEAEAFFRTVGERERKSAHGFQSASIRSITRD